MRGPDDMERAVATWVKRNGAGPFFVMRHVPVQDALHRGQPASFDRGFAYGQLGTFMIELVYEHTRRAPSQ